MLPPEVVQARRSWRQRWKIILGAGVLIAVLLLTMTLLYGETRRTRRLADELQEEKEVLEATADDYSQYVQQEAELNRRIELLQTAVGAPPDWLDVFEILRQDVPNNTWLTDMHISFSAEEGEGQLRMQGYTYNHRSTAQWLEGAERVHWFEDVRCSFSVAETYEQFLIVRFEMTAEILPGDDTYQPQLDRGE